MKTLDDVKFRERDPIGVAARQFGISKAEVTRRVIARLENYPPEKRALLPPATLAQWNKALANARARLAYYERMGL